MKKLSSLLLAGALCVSTFISSGGIKANASTFTSPLKQGTKTYTTPFTFPRNSGIKANNTLLSPRIGLNSGPSYVVCDVCNGPHIGKAAGTVAIRIDGGSNESYIVAQCPCGQRVFLQGTATSTPFSGGPVHNFLYPSEYYGVDNSLLWLGGSSVLLYHQSAVHYSSTQNIPGEWQFPLLYY